jgi:outer membrane protein assembly factor BamA
MFGPHYQYVKVVDAPERFLTGNAGANEIDTSSSQYVGLTLDYKYDIKDKKALPTRGIFFNVNAKYNQEVSGKNFYNVILKSRLTLFIPIHRILTYVFSVSGTTVFNKFEYYQAASLGGLNYTKDNDILRGYRRDRFSGRSSIAFNNNLRIKLFNFKTTIFPGEFGINGFFDVGRVWFDGEDSSVWHNDYGGGIWISPMSIAVISAYYSVSKEENMFKLVLGLLF